MEFSKSCIVWYEYYMAFVGMAGQALFAFQIVEIVRNQSSNNVSLPGFIVSCVSMLSWLLYGYLKEDKVLMGVNLVGVVLSFACIVAILVFR